MIKGKTLNLEADPTIDDLDDDSEVAQLTGSRLDPFDGEPFTCGKSDDPIPLEEYGGVNKKISSTAISR